MNDISREESAKLKGMAMCIIVLHNFVHLISGVKENEMSFDAERLKLFFHAVAEQPSGLATWLFSFLGSYGVQIFILLSGYGLAKKFAVMSGGGYRTIILPAILKVYFLIFPVFIFHAALELIQNLLSDIGWKEIVFQQLNILSFLLMIYNFSYDTLFGSPISILSTGPWWFVFLIAQLYLLAPILFIILQKLGARWWAAIAIAYLLIYTSLRWTEPHGFPLFANSIGHLPEFIFGMGLALYPHRIDWRYGFISGIVFCLSIMNKWTFPLSFLSAGIITLICGRHICSFISKNHQCERALSFLGSISMFMFILNAQIRNITLRLYEGTSPNAMLLGAFFHLVIVIFVAAMYGRIHTNKFQKWLDIIMVHAKESSKADTVKTKKCKSP